MSAQHPPTADQLKNLQYIQTNTPGVYLSVTDHKDRIGDSLIYVGSVSSPYRGLHYRMVNMRAQCTMLKQCTFLKLKAVQLTDLA